MCKWIILNWNIFFLRQSYQMTKLRISLVSLINQHLPWNTSQKNSSRFPDARFNKINIIYAEHLSNLTNLINSLAFYNDSIIVILHLAILAVFSFYNKYNKYTTPK